MTSVTLDVLRVYAAELLAFAADLVIPSARGVARFGDVWADFQVERFKALAPSLQAVAVGQAPPIGRFWWECTKGGSKDSDAAVAILWELVFANRPLLCQVGAADRDQAAELRKAAKDIIRLNPWVGGAITVELWQ